ncbi:MAG: hypothetical protein LRY73_19935 [Bacillus sp. (in: Bacteria)]|nr:hypothetical protein [Bacillus sp. (in: firmicutes)]
MGKFVLWTMVNILLLQIIALVLGHYTTIHWSEMAFFVGGFALFFGYLFSSSGDGFTQRTEARAMAQTMFTYMPKRSTFRFSFSPFFVAAVLFLLYSFVVPYVFL